MSSPTDPHLLALARGRAYRLFAGLCRQGPTLADLAALRAVPELATHLPEPFDPDEAAAAHHRLFVLNGLPYEAVFLDPAGLLEGPVTAAVADSYRRAGWTAPRDASADALAHELAFLAFLCGAESDARRDGESAAAERARELQATFLARHLLPWLPPLALVLRDEGDPFYAALAELLLALAADHAEALARPAAAFALPAPPDLLADDEAGLRQVAAFLATPPWSGLFVSRGALARIGRQRRLPGGFAGREQRLLNLWRAAAAYDAVDTLLGDLIALAQAWAMGAAGIAAAHPPLAPFAAPWAARATATADLLAAMRLVVGSAERRSRNAEG